MGSKDHSFDVVSEVNMMEVDNAIHQAQKELEQRFDFKGSDSTIGLDKTEKKITLKTENEHRLKTLIDMVQSKCVKRGISLKALKFEKLETGMIGGSVKQDITIISGIESDKAKEITKAVKEAKMKVQAMIEGEKVRVKSADIDSLQATIALLKRQDFGIDLQYVNFR